MMPPESLFCELYMHVGSSVPVASGVAKRLSRFSSGGDLRMLEGFGSVEVSTFTIAALVHPPSSCGTVSFAVSVFSTGVGLFSFIFGLFVQCVSIFIYV